jgi:threonine/homoserine efflux transporter RhtA
MFSDVGRRERSGVRSRVAVVVLDEGFPFPRGPLLALSALTDYLSWRRVLFVNVPIAALVLLGTVVLVEGDHDRGGVDLPGALTATAGFASLVYATNRAGTAGWSDSVTIAFLVVAAVLRSAFPLIQRRSASPMMPPRYCTIAAARKP